jgi:hypothetical protein
MDTKVQRSAGLGINMEHPDCGESQTNPGQAAQANGSLQSLAVLCCTVLCCANRHSFHLCYFLIFKSSIPYHKRQTTMSIPQFANFRRFVLTGSIAGVTATGAWYGAGLKMKQDIKQVFAPPLLTPSVTLLSPYLRLVYRKLTSSFFLCTGKTKSSRSHTTPTNHRTGNLPCQPDAKENHAG